MNHFHEITISWETSVPCHESATQVRIAYFVVLSAAWIVCPANATIPLTRPLFPGPLDGRVTEVPLYFAWRCYLHNGQRSLTKKYRCVQLPGGYNNTRLDLLWYHSLRDKSNVNFSDTPEWLDNQTLVSTVHRLTLFSASQKWYAWFIFTVGYIHTKFHLDQVRGFWDANCLGDYELH